MTELAQDHVHGASEFENVVADPDLSMVELIGEFEIIVGVRDVVTMRDERNL